MKHSGDDHAQKDRIVALQTAMTDMQQKMDSIVALQEQSDQFNQNIIQHI